MESGSAGPLLPVPWAFFLRDQLPRGRSQHQFANVPVGGQIDLGEASGAVRGGRAPEPQSASDDQQLSGFRRTVAPPDHTFWAPWLTAPPPRFFPPQPGAGDR